MYVEHIKRMWNTQNVRGTFQIKVRHCKNGFHPQSTCGRGLPFSTYAILHAIWTPSHLFRGGYRISERGGGGAGNC